MRAEVALEMVARPSVQEVVECIVSVQEVVARNTTVREVVVCAAVEQEMLAPRRAVQDGRRA